MQPLVSIIIPLYNAEKFIQETIESALNQTYKNIELIIVDDGSTDSSFDIADKFSKDNIIVVKQKNKGASAARNHGLKLAKGDFIQYLDADDIININKIEYQLNILISYPSDYLIGCNWRYFTNNINDTFKTMPFTIDKTTCFEPSAWLMNRHYMIPHTWLIPKKLVDLTGGWDENLTLNDDGEYFYRLISKAAGVIMDNEVLALYRAGNPNSLSTQRTRKAMISWLNSIRTYKKVMYELLGSNGNNTTDKAFYELNYHCLNKYPDIIDMSTKEMYLPHVIHNLDDNLVYNLTKIVGLNNAKRTRTVLKTIRDTKVVDFIFLNVKKLVKHKNL